MKKFSRLLVLTILGSLALGQLTRWQINPTTAFYFHDFLLVIFLLFHLPSLYKQVISLSKSIFSQLKNFTIVKKLNLALLTIFLLVFLYQTFSYLLPALYFLRFFAYIIFLLQVYQQRLFTQKEWQKIFTCFFFSLALIGLGQYLFLPDTSYLENWGWDDHRYRLIGSWFDPSFQGLAYVFGLVFTFALGKNKKTKNWFLFLLLFAVLLLTYSRSSFLALLLIFLAYLLSCRLLILKEKKLAFNKNILLFIFTLGFFFLLSYFLFVYQARNYLSDSTNLLRTNSLVLRYQNFYQQLQSFTVKTWFFGDGFLGIGQKEPFSFSNNDLFWSKWLLAKENLTVAKKTLPIADNFLILLIKSFGLPIAIFVLWQLWRLFLCWWKQKSPVFYLSLALFIHAQFNQAVFQPFVLLTFGLLMIYFLHQKQGSK